MKYMMFDIKLSPDFIRVRSIFNLLLFIIIVPLFVPFTPKMPAPGLDPSWALGLNQAVAQGLAFGKQIIFTLGPYGCIYTKFFHPATDQMMMLGSLFFSCCYWLLLVTLLNRVSWIWFFSWLLFLLTLVYSKDSLFFSYPLLLGLLVYYDIGEVRPLFTKKSAQITFILLLCPLGLLPLIKGSLLIICSLVVLLIVSISLLFKRRFQAYFTVVVPLISMCSFWCLSGQALVDLPAYLINSFIMAHSFTEAMANNGNVNEVLVYLITASLILCYLMIGNNKTKIVRAYSFLLFFIFLLLSFKAGFVRHLGHAFIASTSIVLAALALAFVDRSKFTAPVMLIALFTFIFIESNYVQINLPKNIKSTYSAAWFGLTNRLKDPSWLKNNFNLTMNFISNQNVLPQFSGSSDIYSYDQTALIASGNSWNPRPIFQSYSVFNSLFARTNERHLFKHSPETIFFKLQAIDNRLPSLEDGLSWPALWQNYKVDGLLNHYILLRKKESKPEPLTLKTLVQGVFSLGQEVSVPFANKPLFIELKLKPTILGALAQFFFKSDELQIIVTLTNGIQKKYRFIAEMAESGFLISPLIETTEEFAQLFVSGDLLNTKSVSSFQIVAEGNYSSLFWSTQYQGNFNSIR